jgi:hypothetical protein
MKWLFILLAMIPWFGCTSDSTVRPFKPTTNPEIHKWYNGHAAAVSITYDSGSPMSDMDKEAQQLILKYGLSLDYEFVSDQMPEHIWTYKRDVLLPAGFGFFGHGHAHINHDELSYSDALASFKLNYTLMRENLDIIPISYAYPLGSGYLETTTMALRDAGFVAGRMHHPAARLNPYIVPDDMTTPVDWFRLPSLVMQDFDFVQDEMAINDAAELIPFLDGTIERTAWLITTFHAIGQLDGWGFFRMDEFEKILVAISQRDMWVGRMDDVTRYILQRENAVLDVDYAEFEMGRIKVRLMHGLDSERFSHEMTVSFDIPIDLVGKHVTVHHEGVPKQHFLAIGTRVMLNLTPSDKAYELLFE